VEDSIYLQYAALSPLIASADRDGRLRHQSREWTRFTGITAEQLRRDGWSTLALRDDAAALESAWRAGIAGVGHFTIDFRCRRAHGRYRACTLAATPLFGGEGIVAEWLISLRVHEAADGHGDDGDTLRQRREQLLSSLAHGLRDPLQAMRQASFVLQLASANEAARTEMHRVIERQITRLTRVATTVLDFISVGLNAIRLRRRPAPLYLLVSLAVAEAQEALTEREQRVDVTVRDPEDQVTADPERLARAIGELLDNASRYSQPGGYIALAARCQGDDVVFTVTDRGIGIPAESLACLFDPLRRDRATRPGAHGVIGIGLAFARHVTRLHGGTLVAESDGPGCGSRFHLRIPRHEPIA
jgi:PAS domain S-box-containing protein